jgi:hypothetical protein
MIADFLAGHGIPYVTREQWGARAPRRITALSTFDVMVTHHTAGGYPATDALERAEMRYTQTYHMDQKGWSDIAYNFLISPSGKVYEGRGELRVGGGTGEPYDQHGWSVCALGYYHPPHNHTVTPDMDHAFAAVWTYFASIGGTRQLRDRDVNQTSCPGDGLAPLVPWPLLPKTNGEDMTPEQEKKLDTLLIRTDLILDHIEGRKPSAEGAGPRSMEPLRSILDSIAAKVGVKR